MGPLHIARHPVTNVEYAAFVEATGMVPPLHWEGGRIPEGKEEHPVVNVSWTDAVAFCEWLSRRVAEGGTKSEDERQVQLPTEAEWEIVSRVLRGGSFYFSPRLLRAAYRYGYLPELRHDYSGFQVLWSSSRGL